MLFLDKRDVEGLDVVGESADGDEVHAGLGVGAERSVGDAAASLGLVAVVDALDGGAESSGVEVIQHDAMDAAVVEDLVELIEVAHFDFDSEVLVVLTEVAVGAVDGCGDAASEVDMIVLEHDHVVETDAVVGASAAFDGVFLKETHVGRSLAGVEEPSVEAVEHIDEAVCLGSDTAEALHEVEGGTFCGEDDIRGAVDGHEDIAFADGVAVVLQDVDSDGEVGVVELIVNELENTFADFDAAEDAVLFGDHFGGVGCGRRDASEGTMVAVAYIFEQRHVNQLVQIRDECHHVKQLF